MIWNFAIKGGGGEPTLETMKVQGRVLILRSFLFIIPKNASFAKIKDFDLPAGESKLWVMEQNWIHFRNLHL